MLFQHPDWGIWPSYWNCPFIRAYMALQSIYIGSPNHLPCYSPCTTSVTSSLLQYVCAQVWHAITDTHWTCHVQSLPIFLPLFLPLLELDRASQFVGLETSMPAVLSSALYLLWLNLCLLCNNLFTLWWQINKTMYVHTFVLYLRSPSTLCCTTPCLWMYKCRVN